MRFYYTIISIENDPQTRPDLSLGGFKSSTLTPNNSFGNLFSDISCYSVRENRDEYIALALVNETGAVAEDVTLYFEYPADRQKDIELAFVAFNANNEMEVIPNPYSQPYNAEFNPADGVANAINIGDLAIGAQIGVWFKKILNIDNITSEYSDESLDENGTPQEANEEINLVIDWTTS
jgi:hypothetical protein